MKFYLLLLIFILLSINTYAYWQTYQNDLRNTGISNGTGYFPLKTANFSDDSLGINFQPLVDDIDLSGNKEIVIFSNDSLIIFNPQLNTLAQAKVGAILGQPTLFNFDDDALVEIIFNSRQNLTDYFFAYQFNNSNLRQQFNITLNNEANFSGIKCLNLNSTNICVFKDKLNYIHIINMTSKTDSSFNTSIYEEYRQTVPAIGDIDNDGRYEAVWWFNQDNISGYGFLVFDLNSRSLETNFNNSGIVDNIFSPLILGSQLVHQLFVLKAQPVLVDLNNDNKLEIAASVFYDDSSNIDARTDWFTELIVYNNNGTKLFTKCETNTLSNVGCNDDSSTSEKWEGSNAFVLDFDGNSMDDICFIKDVKAVTVSALFSYMALNCYNYSGDEIAKVKLDNTGDIKGTVMAADINNDNKKEIITFNNINLINGSLLLSLPLNTTSPIAVDIDGNKGLDLIWTVSTQTKVFLDNNNYSNDLSVSSSDISFAKFNETHVNVSAIIKNIGQVETNNIKTIMYNAETKDNNTALLNIKKNGNITFSSILPLKKDEKVLVSVDYDNEINESNEENNFAEKIYGGLPYVFVNIGAGQSLQLPLKEIKNYIKNNLVLGYFTDDKDKADVQVYISKTHSLNLFDRSYTRDKYNWGYESFAIIDYFDKQFDKPYAGIVGSYILDGKNYIAVYGNNIEGDVAGAKEFIKRQADFLKENSEMSFVIDDENIEAIGIYDYLHQPGNEQYYGEDSANFANVVKNALNGETFSTEMKIVTTSDGVQLRLKHLIPNRSSTYLEILNASGVPVEMPVVLARGLWSNLTSWEVFAGELANEGRDVWLIEITGGPGQDCDTCVDYTFDDLTDKYVPTLLNAVLNLTGKDKLQYVGFSNGCRATLSSLEKGKFNSSKIETFVAVGCPGAFNGTSLFAECMAEHGNAILNHFGDNNINHIAQGQFSEQLARKSTTFSSCWLLARFLDPDGSISRNLGQHYLTLIQSNQDKQPGIALNFTKFALIYGTEGFGSNNDNDYVVTENDELAIFNNIISSNKEINSYRLRHNNLPDNKRAKNKIKEGLK